MDRYVIAVDHAASNQFPSQAQVTYTHDVINTLSLLLSLSITLTAIGTTLKGRVNKNQSVVDYALIQSTMVEIESILNQLLQVLDCSRVSVALFHGRNLIPIPELKELSRFKYYSIIWESMRTGNKSTKMDYQNIPLVEIISILPKCLASPEEFIPFSIDMEMSDALTFDMANTNNGLIFLRILGDYNQGFFGILCFQYSNEIYAINPDIGSISLANAKTLRKTRDLFILVERKTSSVKDFILKDTKKFLVK